MAKALERRITDLEQADASGYRSWHTVVQRLGQTEGGAIAAYEAQNGPIGEDNSILRVTIKPGVGEGG